MRRPLPPLAELALVRTKEFVREPEAVFWVLVFPLILAVGLGLAFRSRPPDRIPAAVAALSRSPALLVSTLSPGDGREALRTGRVALLVEPGPPPTFRLDPTR